MYTSEQIATATREVADLLVNVGRIRDHDARLGYLMECYTTLWPIQQYALVGLLADRFAEGPACSHTAAA